MGYGTARHSFAVVEKIADCNLCEIAVVEIEIEIVAEIGIEVVAGV